MATNEMMKFKNIILSAFLVAYDDILGGINWKRYPDDFSIYIL